MRTSLLCGIFLATATMALPATSLAEEYLVIVNKENGNAVTADFLAKAYRGEAKTWPSGGNITTVAQTDESPARVAFDKAVLGKSPGQSRALWAQLTFTGKAVPPKMVETDEDAVKAVADNKNAVGYVSTKANVSSVKVVK